jgi:hypothetical protein
MWNLDTKKIEQKFRRDGLWLLGFGWCVCTVVKYDKEYVIGGDRCMPTIIYMTEVDDVIVWEKDTGERVDKWKGHASWVSGVTPNPTDPFEFLSYSEDNTMLLQVLGCMVHMCVDGVWIHLFSRLPRRKPCRTHRWRRSPNPLPRNLYGRCTGLI